MAEANISMLAYMADHKPPTLKHRPAITAGILGTCYGINAAGEVRYFDYDWEAALEYAGVTDSNTKVLEGVDLRVSPAKRDVFLPGYDMWNPERRIRKGQKAWWVLKETS
jgi:hypothetical protein